MELIAHKQQLEQFQQPYAEDAKALGTELIKSPELTVENSIAELDSAAERYETLPSWPCSVIETNNAQVVGGEVQIIDANTGEAPHYKMFFRLHNWAEQFDKKKDEGVEPTEYRWESKGNYARSGEEFGTVQKALTYDVGNAAVSLIYDVDRPTYDGLVEIRIPKLDGESLARAADAEQAINSALNQLTGCGLVGTPNNSAQEQDLIMQQKEYEQAAAGPLTQEERQRLANNVTLARVSSSHRAYVDNSETGALPEELGFRHLLKSLSALEDVIVAGELGSVLQRLKQGDVRYPNRSDLYNGGGDLVYTYLTKLDEGQFASYPTILFNNKPSRRLDVRAYATDAYGQIDKSILTTVGSAVGRQSKVTAQYAIDARRHPKNTEELRGMHEVDFHSSLGLSEAVAIYLPNIADSNNASSFYDYNWSILIAGALEAQGIDIWDGSVVDTVKTSLFSSWGNPDAVKSFLTDRLKMHPDQADIYVTGMDMPPKERLIARLNKRGVTEIAGRPLEEVIQYGISLEDFRQQIDAEELATVG